MLDTGADVTIIAGSEWPANWVVGMISGIGGVAVFMRNKQNVIVKGPKGKLATIQPFVAPLRGYHWLVLPQGMKNSPTICQWYVPHILSPITSLFPDAIIYHYVDNILVCVSVKTYLDMTIRKTIKALEDAGFEIHKDKVQYTSPWTYLSLQICERTVVPQHLTIKDDPRTLRDLHQLCRSFSWVHPVGDHDGRPRPHSSTFYVAVMI
ncbi:endogenous retrovirus group K member 18 Pol protein-like protein [Turdus rufiventris]|nr:endogenous retrovirus group K member 18 Pol protein-like protein [Turdus rufiventris]